MELIEKDGRDGSRRLFDAFYAVLTAGRLIAKEGSIVDASFVDAPRQRNNREQNQQIKDGQRPDEFDLTTAKGRQKDCDALWTKKITKLISVTKTTPANVHDSQVFQDLVDESDAAVLADSAYHSQVHEGCLLECNAQRFFDAQGISQ